MRGLITILAGIALVAPATVGSTPVALDPVAVAPAPSHSLTFKAHADAAVEIDPTSVGGSATIVRTQVAAGAVDVTVELQVTGQPATTVSVDGSGADPRPVFLPRIVATGEGAATVTLRGTMPDGSRLLAVDEVWFDARSGRLVVSDVGIEDLRFLTGRADPTSNPLDEVRVGPPEAPLLVADDATSCASDRVCATGTAEWTDRTGTRHPVRSAYVDLVEIVSGSSVVRATVLTNDVGGYDVSFATAGAVDVFVQLRAAGPGFEFVVDRGGSLQARAKFSTIRNGVAPGTAITASFSMGQVDAEDTVFSLHDAMTHAIEYLPTIGAASLPAVEILFPANGTFFSPSSGRVNMLEADRWDWDVMLHEYGHFVAGELGIEDNPGGRHSGGENLGNRLDKATANKLAWGEGWPTYFAVSTLLEGNAAALGIPNIGDTRYQDTEDTFINDDLEGAQRLGEDNELTVSSILWDLYDTAADGVDRTAFGTVAVWDTLDLGDPETLSEAAALFTPDRGARTNDTNCVLGQMNVAPQLFGPASQAAPSTSPTLAWTRGNGGNTGRNDRFVVEYRNADSTVVLYSATTPSTLFRAPDDAWDRVVAEADGTVNVSVLGTANERAPSTGPYRSCVRSFTGAPATAIDDVIVSVVPARHVDTRLGESTFDGIGAGDGRRSARETYRVRIGGRGVVGDRARAVVVNLTASQPIGSGYVTAFDCSLPVPPSSSLNHVAATDVANEVVVAMSVEGDICFFTSTETDLVVDVVGYVEWASPLVTVTPARLLETRAIDTGTTDGRSEAIGRLAGDTEVTVQIGGRAGVADDAVAAILNVAAVGPARSGFVTVHPCTPTRPLAASLNVSAGVDRADEIIAPLDADGNICLYTSGHIDAIIDVVGYIPASSGYVATAPARFVDTRFGEVTVDGRDQGAGRREDGQTLVVQITGRHGVPADATAVVAYVTAVDPLTPGFVTVWPCDEPLPLASSLNHDPRVDGGNELVARVDGGGRICVFTRGPAHITVDVAGHVIA